MLIVDSIKTAEQIAFKHYETEQERYAHWLEEHTQLAKFNDDPEISPLETSRKIGRPMLHTELERRLSKLNPRLVFVWGDLHAHHKMMCIPYTNMDLVPDLVKKLDPLYGLQKLFVYPTGAIPERSIWRRKEEYVPDPYYVPRPGDIDRSDWEWVPIPGHEAQHKRDGHLDPVARFHGHWQRKSNTSGRAGWNKVTHAWGEYRRGWRTVLISLVKLGLLSTQQVEDEFLADNTPEWAKHMGKRNIYRPW